MPLSRQQIRERLQRADSLVSQKVAAVREVIPQLTALNQKLREAGGPIALDGDEAALAELASATVLAVNELAWLQDQLRKRG